MRVIVSGRGHATEGIAALAEGELKSHVEAQPSYIKDTTDFLRKVNDIRLPNDKNCPLLLFCMDVCKLYPSVPKQEGLAACKKALDSRQNPRIPTADVMDMIELILENNNFSLGSSKHYVQINGTAIGSKLGRNYACTYMGSWEDELLKGCKEKPLVYFRFVDDIFGIWRGSLKCLEEFHERANSIHRDIKVDLRYSETELEFLDVKVGIKEGRIVTDLYTKPCDSKAYLHFMSDHPSHTKKAIPSGLAKRARRICSSVEKFRQHADELVSKLATRGYPKNQVKAEIEKVGGMKRSDLLERSVGKQKEGVPMVVTYSSCLPNINKILRSKRHILERSNDIKDIFNNNMFVSYKRGTNLGDLLVHRKTKRQVRGGVTPSGKCGKNCCICRIVYCESSRIEGPSKLSCTYDKTIGCRSSNIIYGIWCTVCQIVVYVGETGGTLYQRTQNHLSSIRCERQGMEVARHFNGEDHAVEDMRVIGLEKVRKNWVAYRRVREQRWMGLLGTLHCTGGLNKKT